MSDLINELEQAGAAYLTPIVGSLANVYSGKSSGDKQQPCVIVEAEGEGEEDFRGSGNYWVLLNFKIRVNAGTESDEMDPAPGSVALVSLVNDAVRQPNLDTLLNAQGRTLTVFPTGFLALAPTRNEMEIGIWEDIIPVRVYCCGSIIPP